MSTIDLAALLAPLAGDNPSGIDVVYEPIVDEIKEARRADADYLSQGDWKTEIKAADWPKVKNFATKVLVSQSKDLQISCWLIEALTHLYGFAGARDGFVLLDGLLTEFWDTLYPEKDGDDVELRIGRLVWLDNNLPLALRTLPMTGPAGESRGHSWARWQESRDVDNLARQNEALFKQALKEGKINSEMWDAAVNQTSPAFYQSLLADSRAALDAIKALVKTVDDKFGDDAPSLGQIVETLTNVVKLATKIAGDKGVLPTATMDTPSEAGTEDTSTMQAATAAADNVRAGPPKTREEALRRLHEIAEFYRSSEPHSPVTYLLEKAARWGNMRLDEWIREVVRDDSTLSRLKELLGYSE